MIAPLLALAMLHQNAALPDDARGEFLVQNCQTAIRTMQGPQPPGTDYMPVFRCVDYIGGFVDGYTGRSGGNVCLNKVSQGTLAQMYVAYMEKHPKLLEQEKSVGLLEALVDAYPCPAK